MTVAHSNKIDRFMRFSLLNLVLMTTIVALCITVYLLYQEVEPLRAELRQLRNEAGYLTITDPTRPHAIELSTDSRFKWKWKVMVPEDETWFMKANVGKIPAPSRNSELSGDGIGIRPNEGGEAIVEMSVYRNLTDSWMCDFSVREGGTIRKRLTESQANALQECADRIDRSDVRAQTVAGEHGEPLMLFRRRLPLPNEQGSIGSWDAGPGVALWITSHY